MRLALARQQLLGAGAQAGMRLLLIDHNSLSQSLYLLAGWLQSRYPQFDPLSHDAGHLWNSLLGLEGDPHFGTLHILSNLLIFGVNTLHNF